MAQVKFVRGNKDSSPGVNDGNIGLYIDSGELFFDFVDASGNPQRLLFGSTETWTFTLADGSTVTKNVVVK